MRFLFRRIPLFFGSGLIFFGMCFAATFFDNIGMVKIESFLKSINSFEVEWQGGIFFILLALIFLKECICWCFFSLKYDSLSVKDDGECCIRNIDLNKTFTVLLLLCLLVYGFFIVISSEFALVFGLTAFSTVTFVAILIDRTLGFTRRNERYALFSSKAKGLSELMRFRKMAGMNFDESYLNECHNFYEDLRMAKYNDTIGDSFYILNQLEKFKN